MSNLSMGERLHNLRTLLPNGSEMTNVREKKINTTHDRKGAVRSSDW